MITDKALLDHNHHLDLLYLIAYISMFDYKTAL